VGVTGQALAVALVFGVAVFVHEGGHFAAARLCGMAVHEFSIGFGRPLLFWVKRGDTQYSFRLWPFFSYVRIAGMEPGEDHPQGFDKKNRLAQAFVLALGCIMDFLLGAAILVFIGMAIGRFVGISNTIEKVMPGSAAAKVGLMPGDRLVGFDGKAGLPLEKVQTAIQGRPGKPITLEIERSDRRLSLPITPEQASAPAMREDGSVYYKLIGRIGIVFKARMQRMGVWESVAAGFIQSYEMIKITVIYLPSVFLGKMPVMGPVGVVHQLYTDVQVSWSGFLFTAAALAIGLGFLNLLPIPPLDGSRLAITALEAIRRKPFDKRKETMVHLVGFAVLMCLVVLLTYKDILRIVKFGG
jgi:regulator of sigma E protease